MHSKQVNDLPIACRSHAHTQPQAPVIPNHDLGAGIVQTHDEVDMELTSSASAKGGETPRKHTCDAESVSPPLPWTTTTAKHGRFGADLRRVGCRARHSGALDRAWSMFRGIGYGGPSAPRGPAHRYLFKLPTVNVDLALSAGATKGQVVKAMQGHVQAGVPLVALYRRLQELPPLHNCRSASLDRHAT